MIIEVLLTERAEKSYTKLPLHVKKKANRQFKRLIDIPQYPSLRVKKKQGENIFEARVDYHYRFTFIVEEKTLRILSIGPHDEGLGKK